MNSTLKWAAANRFDVTVAVLDSKQIHWLSGSSSCRRMSPTVDLRSSQHGSETDGAALPGPSMCIAGVVMKDLSRLGETI